MLHGTIDGIGITRVAVSSLVRMKRRVIARALILLHLPVAEV
jgi:hypothetical protein